jgi:drug/metabolite transporter (DMT)-like permease
MTWLLLIPTLVSVACLVAGQILLKKAMAATRARPIRWQKFLIAFAPGVTLMATWFYLWLTLLQVLDLSLLYPFEALTGVFLAFAARIFLKEKISPRLWLGIACIVAGVFLVARS